MAKLSGQERKHLGRQFLLAKTGGRCYLCGDSIPIEKPEGCSDADWFLIRPTRDHVIPRCRGGMGYHSNLMPAHSWCNERRHSIPIEYHRMFVLFRRWYTTVGQPDPSETKIAFLQAKSRWCQEVVGDELD
jgi:5-methylcytosine-specific restriction endonuclease McrA